PLYRTRQTRKSPTLPAFRLHLQGAALSYCTGGADDLYPSQRPASREMPMTTLLYSHPACLEHDPGSYHPESPDRLRAVLEALSAEEFALLDRREAPRAALDDITRVHPRDLVEQVLAAVPETGHVGIDADTVMSPGSGDAALR